jgi:histidyl-tRNA synthetase
VFSSFVLVKAKIMAQKPSLPKGVRDFGPEQMTRRNYLLDTIKSVFKKYGFMPIETPAMENLSTLTGKYGDEGDQLLFKILNSGDFLAKTEVSDFEAGAKELSKKITEKGLKYDLTVPFARFVVMNQNDIAFPFKRYQVQPVWRADRPQKGRYREFYQCDADVVGTDSLVCEAELMAMVGEVFKKLNLEDYRVSISSRKVLEGLAEVIGASDQFNAFCVILDKLDKIGLDKMLEEMKAIGISPLGLERLTAILNIDEPNRTKIETLRKVFMGSAVGIQGLEELESTLNYMESLGASDSKLHFDLTLARGLSYYTGIIYEVKPTSVQMGTISAGGRYDNLTGVFGLPDVSGVGISFGIDRIYDVLDELNLFPADQLEGTKVMITNFDDASLKHALGLSHRLRNNDINCEVFPESAKMKKQMSYADKKNIPYVIMVGSEEIESGIYTVKDMKEGEQYKKTLLDLIDFLVNKA